MRLPGNLPWREAGPPNNHVERVDLHQQVVNKAISVFGDRLRVGRGTTRAEDAQGTPTQSDLSPSIIRRLKRCVGCRQNVQLACERPTSRKVDVRLPGRGNFNSHGARPVHPRDNMDSDQ